MNENKMIEVKVASVNNESDDTGIVKLCQHEAGYGELQLRFGLNGSTMK